MNNLKTFEQYNNQSAFDTLDAVIMARYPNMGVELDYYEGNFGEMVITNRDLKADVFKNIANELGLDIEVRHETEDERIEYEYEAPSPEILANFREEQKERAALISK